MGLGDWSSVDIMQQFYGWDQLYVLTKGDFEGGDGLRITFFPEHVHVCVRTPDLADREMSITNAAIERGMAWAAEKVHQRWPDVGVGLIDG